MKFHARYSFHQRFLVGCKLQRQQCETQVSGLWKVLYGVYLYGFNQIVWPQMLQFEIILRFSWSVQGTWSLCKFFLKNNLQFEMIFLKHK